MGQGGLHKYFEVDLVNMLSNSWEDKTLSYAMQMSPAMIISLKQKALQFSHKKRSRYLRLAIGLAIDSYSQKDRLFRLDRSFAIKKITKPSKIIRRKDPAKVIQYFQKIIQERMAVSADMLALMWLEAFENSGVSDIHGYESHYYPMVPEPIKPTYYSIIKRK